MTEDLLATTRAWIDSDPDPVTRAELEGLVAAGAMDELAERMDGTLPFGTAGLRGRVEAGSNRMNRAVVIRATRGLADHLLVHTPSDRGPVVVGRDARASSAVLMADTIGVLAAAGFVVRYFEDPTPTPLVAFAAKHLSACAAVVVTASHNPPADNGYKVYDASAAQIVPPVDLQIAEAIDEVGSASDVPQPDDPFGAPDVEPVPADLWAEYLDEVRDWVPTTAGDRDLSIVYTPLHGVGGRWVVAALDYFGFKRVHPVAAQFEPDGRFPTVAFPNPEEPGALDLAHGLASAVDADLVIANDPDTDRLAVSLPVPGGGWRQLTGNQIGVLLAEFLLDHSSVDRPVVINSIVSSPMLGMVAAAHGAAFRQTLTGFKWICNAALDSRQSGGGEFVFGFEEALGYSIGGTVRDKDGISAAVAFAALAAEARSGKRLVWDRLEDLYRRDGLWVSTQLSIVRPGSEGALEINAAMERLTSDLPGTLAGYDVESAVDYLQGASTRPRFLPAAPLVELSLGSAGRALVRPSGTEPKLKIYVDLRAELTGDDWWGAETSLLGEAQSVAEALAAHLDL